MPDRAELGWLALLDEPRDGAHPVIDGGSGAPAGYLLLVRRHAKPDRFAVRVEPSLIAPRPAAGGVPGAARS